MVDAHAGSPLAILANIFPYDSFFMPLFIFISGYFFNQEQAFSNTDDYIYRKFKNLIVPYYKYNIIISLAWLILCLPFPLLRETNSKYLITNLDWHLIFQKIIYIPLTYGTPFDLISPSWFLISLFFAILTYLILKKFTYKTLNEYQFLILLIFLGIISIYLARKGFSVEPHLLLLLKIFFFIPIFHIGFLIKNNKFDPHPIKSIGFGFIINFLILLFYSNKDISFESLAFMLNFKTDNLLLPYITSLSGIAFYYGICKLIAPLFGNSKVLNFISENTLGIFLHQLIPLN